MIKSTLKYDVGIVGSGPVGLMLSSLLNHYGIKNIIVDRRVDPVVHPQAHFINARSMEIIQMYFPTSFQSLTKAMPYSESWR